MIELWLAFAAGTLSSLHCIGMCGPIVMGCIAPRPLVIAVPGSEPPMRISGFKSTVMTLEPYILYNCGRVISYSVIGIAAGLIGSVAFFSQRLQSGFSIGLGILMIAMALLQIYPYPEIRRKKKEGIAEKMIRGVMNSHALEAKFLVGFLTPLLPCGLLYGMAAEAAASSSPISGAILMGAFALGSAPALVITGFFSGMLNAKLRKTGTTVAAFLLIAMGMLTIGRGAGLYKAPHIFQPEQGNCCAKK